jgi:hypothetical protein
VLSGIAAAEIAEAEFSPSPSLIITAESAQDGLLITSLATDFIPALDDARQLELPLARLQGQEVSVAWLEDIHGQLEHAWTPVSHGDVITHDLLIEAAFHMTIALLTTYWSAHGVNWRADNHADEINVILSAPRGDDVAKFKSYTPTRLEHELVALRNAGYDVTLFNQAHSIVFFLECDSPLFLEVPSDFPTQPPTVWVTEEGNIRRLHLHPREWSSERSLLDLVYGWCNREHS